MKSRDAQGETDMRAFLITALLTLAATPAGAQKVESAGGNWSQIPPMEMSDYRSVSAEIIDRLHALGRRGECRVPGLSARSIDIDVPFLVRFTAEGAAEHIVVRKLDCPEAESLLAGIVTDWVRQGNVKSTGENQERWYRSRIQIASKQ
jgi:hypothetical protein